MKIVSLVLVVMVCLSAFGYSEESKNGEGIMKANAIIDSKTFLTPEGKKKLMDVSKDISSEWKMMIYSKNEKSGVLGCALNLLVPSLGSWVMGDTTGALVVVIGVGGGILIYAIGYGMYASSYSYSSASGGTTLGLLGAGIMTVFEIVGLILPWTYADYYNKELKGGLGMLAALPAEQNYAFAYNPNFSGRNNINLINVDLVNYRF
jgi:hypothetical protein